MSPINLKYGAYKVFKYQNNNYFNRPDQPKKKKIHTTNYYREYLRTLFDLKLGC